MRAFSLLEITDSDITSDKVDFQCTYKNVYDYHENYQELQILELKLS